MMEKIEDAARFSAATAAEVTEEEVAPYVTLQSLRKALPTDAWRGLMDSESPLAKTLTSQFFKSEGHTEQ